MDISSIVHNRASSQEGLIQQDVLTIVRFMKVGVGNNMKWVH